MKPKEVGLFEAKTHLSELVDQAARGQVFYITRRGRRVAELRPLSAEKLPRVFGSAKNEQFWIADDFDETPDDFTEYT